MSELLSSDPQTKSSMRWVMVGSAVVANVVVWGAFIVLSWKKGEMINVPDNVIYLYSTATGLPIVGKVIQKFAEMQMGKGKAE